jgi:hypothetical protein
MVPKELTEEHLSVREFLASKPYSPDLAPSDLFLFPRIKEIFKGRHFDDIGDNR